jgi:hypothetical protein
MAAKEAQIYPLPISHENQCTTLGAASNLDLFKNNLILSLTNSRNSSFFKPLEKISNLTERTNGLLLKSLEYHKKTQRDYEHILRGKCTVEEITENDDEEIIAVVNQDDEEDSMSD